MLRILFFILSTGITAVYAQRGTHELLSIPIPETFVHYSVEVTASGETVEKLMLTDSFPKDSPASVIRPMVWHNRSVCGFHRINVVWVPQWFPPAATQVDRNGGYIYKAVKPAGNAVFVDGIRALEYDALQTKMYYFFMKQHG